MNLGNTIAKLRKNNNLTQAELAEKLNVSYQAISQWENANTYPDITMLPEIAKIFNVSIDELFGHSSKKESLNENLQDDTLYCLITKGNNILKSKELKEVLEENQTIKFELKGEVLNVTSHLNVTCDNVNGNVTASGNVTCDKVGQGVKASGNIICDDVGNGCYAGGHITCDNINGDVTAGGSIECDIVQGNVRAGGSIRIKNG